jgi:hypothetical protein
MKVQVENTQTQIEVGQYYKVNKGALKAVFTLIEYPTGRKTMDCKYFVKGDNHWFSFPQKEVKKPGAEKPEYIPLVSYLNKEYLAQFQIAVLSALKEQESNGQTNAYQKQAAPLQDEASSVWFG